MINKDTESRRGRVIRYAPLFLWLAVIFYLSSDNGSMPETSRFIRPVLQFLFPSATVETIDLYHGYIRKAAHFTEYAVLAFLAVRAFAGSSVPRLRAMRYAAPIVLATIVAMLDEANQSLGSTRSGSVWDVLLDITGSVVTAVILWSAGWPERT